MVKVDTLSSTDLLLVFRVKPQVFMAAMFEMRKHNVCLLCVVLPIYVCFSTEEGWRGRKRCESKLSGRVATRRERGGWKKVNIWKCHIFRSRERKRKNIFIAVNNTHRRETERFPNLMPGFLFYRFPSSLLLCKTVNRYQKMKFYELQNDTHRVGEEDLFVRSELELVVWAIQIIPFVLLDSASLLWVFMGEWINLSRDWNWLQFIFGTDQGWKRTRELSFKVFLQLSRVSWEIFNFSPVYHFTDLKSFKGAAGWLSRNRFIWN